MALPIVLLALLFVAARSQGQCPNAVEEVPCRGPRSANEYLLQLNQSAYDKSSRPPCRNGTSFGPTVVEVQLKLTQVNKVDAKVGTMHITGYLRSWWYDPRLVFDSKAEGGCADVIVLSSTDRYPPIWMPDLYVDNMVSREIEGTAFLTQIRYDGYVWRSEQVVLVVKFTFNLGKLPYDQHVGHVTIASYSMDISNMRVVAKDGIVGETESGVGLVAPPMKSTVWSLKPNDVNAEVSGFSTPGWLHTTENWDYLRTWWLLKRKPRFFILHVVVPCTLFLLVSYIQFFVDANAAPARAALAVIPILIMRTMGNSLYSTISEGSQNMWLDDFVTASMFLCVSAAIHFSVVQYLRMIERKHEAKLAGLIKTKDVAQKLVDIARSQQVPLITLLQKFAPVETELTEDQLQEIHNINNSCRSFGPLPSRAASDMHQVRIRSEAAKTDNVTEADLLFIMYAKDIFKMFDEDHSDKVSPKEVRKALQFFGIYMNETQVMQSMCRFLRDLGLPTPLAESQSSLSFSQFVGFLMQIDRYSLRRDEGLMHIKYYLQGIAPSERWDVAARFGFPVLIALQFIVFHVLLMTVY